ncbi:hypothetical protein ACTJJB_22445 [Chitinophaga sp. 22536]|uniref:hypothetical protein n=1 Tax=unclassified Chitinophaga TaxID=2619133 RepID=UPI003F876B57
MVLALLCTTARAQLILNRQVTASNRGSGVVNAIRLRRVRSNGPVTENNAATRFSITNNGDGTSLEDVNTPPPILPLSGGLCLLPVPVVFPLQ